MRKWDYRFLDLANHIASWSKDPSTQCGAVIVNEKRVIVGVGYNGFPRGVGDDSSEYRDRDNKYMLVVHAEANAILNANGPTEGCTIYVWPFPPCNECAKLIVQAGIKKVVSYRPDPELAERWSKSLRYAARIFDEAGVDQVLLEEDGVSWLI